MNFKIIQRLSIVLSYLLVIRASVITNSNEQLVVCPKMCTCDMIEGLRRADCSHENLISTHTDVPDSVEILDLSINKISFVEDDDFKTHVSLVKLFLSDNAIHTISLNAFSTLRKLQTLDLSHNRLEQLHEDLFEHNEKLIDLNLSNNNFISLDSRPLLKSSSIMYLHLSECKIPQLHDSIFHYLPSLRSVDLSNNLMITLSKDVFVPVKKLRSIDLHENRWQCDSSSVRNTISWMKKRVPSIHIENCFLNPHKHKPKFEKMELDLDFHKANRQEVAIDQVWHMAATPADYWASLEQKTCAFNEIQDPASSETCANFIECQKRYSELFFAYTEMIAAAKAKPDSNEVIRKVAIRILLCGIFIGALFATFITYSVMYLVKKCRESRENARSPHAKTMRELRREFRERNNFEHSRLNESPVVGRSSRRPTGNMSSQEQSQIYSNHENTRQFLVNLFSKRQPRFVRNNSQIANIQNRYLPPLQIRSEAFPSTGNGVSPVAPTSSSFIWEPSHQNQVNDELEQMLNSRQSSAFSVWNNYYGIEDLRRPESGMGLYEVVPVVNTTPAALSRTVSRETPPPPYADCSVALNRTDQQS
ncbi:uncharacterized protein LOC128742961 [Sabethes cyaneus]|uniref:uncharacterized protein LOC128742961 n=1 Tax=Sabethes cyaneus TaxID=53552 RepID=UPI00237DED80|nr:uncharacterized protein LOC128742961 [Sabethes cyaneus]